MKIPEDVHVQWVEDEAVVLNARTGELHYLNPPSALIYALVLEFGMPKALEQAIARTEGREDEVEQEFQRLVRTFEEKGILAEDPAVR